MANHETYFDHVFPAYNKALRDFDHADKVTRGGGNGSEELLRRSVERLPPTGNVIDRYRLVLSYLVAYERKIYGERIWPDAWYDPLIMQVLEALNPDERWTGMQRNLVWHGSQWQAAGARIFEPTAALTQRLMTLRLQGIHLADIQLPFHSFYLHMPLGVGPRVLDEAGEEFPLRGVFICDGGTLEEHHDTENHVLIDAWHFFMIGNWGDNDVIGGRKIWRDQIFYWIWPVSDYLALDHIVEKTAGKLSTFNHGRGRGNFCDLCWWIINFLVYLGDPSVRRETRYLDPEAQRLHEKMGKHKGRKRDRIKDELRKRGSRQVIRIGANVAPVAPGARLGRKLEVRQHVRGHKKKVAIGAGRVDRKEVKIAPYWRGPEDGEESCSKYMLT